MTMSSVLKTSGFIQVLVAMGMIPAVLVCLIYGELHEAWGFALAIGIGLILGILSYLLFRKRAKALHVRDGFLILAISWLTAAVLGAVPYMFCDIFANPADAFFESASGFSTTGVTAIADIESAPYGIMFWRATTSWMAALGILVLAVALMPSLGVNGTDIATPDKPSVRINALTPKIKRITAVLVMAYVSATILLWLLLLPSGMSLFDALIHSMGTVSTGGFSNYSDGLAHFTGENAIAGGFAGGYIRFVIALFMIVCGGSCTLYYSAMRGGIKVISADTEFKIYLVILSVAGLLLFAGLALHDVLSGDGFLWISVFDSLFHSISILTTTGYSTAEVSLWPVFCQMVLLLLILIGACTSSVGSGNKIARMVVVIKLIFYRLKTRIHATAFNSVKLNGNPVSNDTVSGVTNHLFLYMVMAFVGAFVVALENIDLMQCFIISTSLLSNAGPCLVDLGSGISTFTDFNGFTKVFLSFLMIAGRLELYTILILFTPGFWKSE